MLSWRNWLAQDAYIVKVRGSSPCESTNAESAGWDRSLTVNQVSYD